MKFTLIFFTASISIFMVYHKDTNKRAKNVLDIYPKKKRINEEIIATLCET